MKWQSKSPRWRVVEKNVPYFILGIRVHNQWYNDDMV